MSKEAIVLSGGGVNGAYEIGVLRALFEDGSSFSSLEDTLKLVCGTSVGSFNSAALVDRLHRTSAREAVDELEELWLDRVSEKGPGCGNGVYRMKGNPRQFMDPRCLASDPVGSARTIASDGYSLLSEMVARGVQAATSNETMERRMIESMNLASLIDSSPLEKLVHDTIDFAAVESSPVEIAIAATEWSSGELKFFDNQDLGQEWGSKAILASCAIPILFPVVEVNRGHYVDGGLVLNTPLRPALESEMDVVHLIYLEPEVEAISWGGLANTVDSLCRMMVINLAESMRRELKVIQDWNHLLNKMEEESPDEKESVYHFARMWSRMHSSQRKRPLAIHIHRPEKALNALENIMNFDRRRIRRLIDEGYEETRSHDCRRNGCLLPAA